MECALRSMDVVQVLAMALAEDAERTARLLRMTPVDYIDGMRRLQVARLISRRGVLRERLLLFLEHGVPHCFPASVGEATVGLPTGAGAVHLRPLSSLVGKPLVWETPLGSEQGRKVEPLDPRVPAAALEDVRLHALLAATDLLRIGRARERRVARMFLEQVLLHRDSRDPVVSG